jgi:molybdenum cofactor cytidylyltransferase
VIAAVILAAGRSSRMGRSKALLPHGDESSTFVSHAITEARRAGASPIVVVGRHGDEALRAAVADGRATFVVNPDPDRGQLSSLLCGVDAVQANDEICGVMVLPVDVPLVSAGVMRLLLARAAREDAAIVRAVHRGRHGHPVYFRRDLFAELRAADPHVGAKAVLRADEHRVIDLEVGDVGVTEDVDTSEDYRRIFGRDA